ncbi:MAG TPA: hypothetical protein VEJ63_12030 [Planctomycetota bacterium]|nr:hypothetical protein [Planctomycetota bacterium]
MPVLRAIIVLLLVIALLIGGIVALLLYLDNDGRQAGPEAAQNSSSNADDAADRARKAPAVSTDAAGIDAYFKDIAAKEGPKLPPPRLETLVGKWSVKITAIDLGPDVPAPDLSDLQNAPQSTFTIAASDGGFVMKPDKGGTTPRALSHDGADIVARMDGAPEMRMQLVDGTLKGSVDQPVGGRTEFHATRVP